MNTFFKNSFLDIKDICLPLYKILIPFIFIIKILEEIGIVMPIVELHTKFLRPAKYDDLLTIKTQLRELPTDHRIEFHHEVLNEEGKLLTIGRIVLYFLDAKTMARTVMPQELTAHLTPYFS